MRTLIVMLFGLVACSRGPSCEDVVDKLMSFSTPAGMSRAPRAQLLANCKAEEGINLAMRRCVVASSSLQAAKACELKAALERLAKDRKTSAGAP